MVREEGVVTLRLHGNAAHGVGRLDEHLDGAEGAERLVTERGRKHGEPAIKKPRARDNTTTLRHLKN